jgi:hypothetical protein
MENQKTKQKKENTKTKIENREIEDRTIEFRTMGDEEVMMKRLEPFESTPAYIGIMHLQSNSSLLVKLVGMNRHLHGAFPCKDLLKGSRGRRGPRKFALT